MSKVHVVAVVSELDGSSNRLGRNCLDGFNPIRHSFMLLERIDRVESVTLWSDLELPIPWLRENLTTRHLFHYRHLDLLPHNGGSPLFPRAVHDLAARTHADPADLILFLDLMLYVPDSRILIHAIKTAEKEQRVTLGVRRAQTHPCLMFSLRDPAIMDLRLPAHRAVTYKDLYVCDYNIIRDAKTHAPIHRRQDFPALYESLRGIALFKPEWLEQKVFPSDPSRIHPFLMEGCFLIETPLDLLKASISWRKASREGERVSRPRPAVPLRLPPETEVVPSRETASWKGQHP